MVYMGSKAKYAEWIVPILQKAIDDNNVKIYIEPFCGGCNIIDKIKCEQKFAYDRSETLIALLQQAQEDFSKIPTSGSREMWDEGKAYVKDKQPLTTMSLADVGAIEFFGSYCNGGFPRGYAKNTTTRDYYKEAYNNLKKQSENLKDIVFKCQNYWELDENTKNAVIYIDPPYQGTKQYNYASEIKMDYNFFWDWVRKISQDNFVFISEQQAPEDFQEIWHHAAKRTTGTDNNFKTTERLFKLS